MKSRSSRRLSETAAGLALTIVFSCTASAQSVGRKPNTRENLGDSTAVLFEDVYGRFPDGVLPSVSVTQSQSSYDGLNSPTPPDTRFTNGGINVMLGNRKSYELYGNFQNSGGTGISSSQFYNLGLYSRPVTGWEFGGSALYGRSPGQGPADQYSLDLRVLNLSGGEVSLSERRMQQYYYFSNLLPDPGQTVVDFAPAYDYSRSSYINTTTIETPFSFSYGLADGFALVADADYTQLKNTYPVTASYSPQAGEYKNSELRAGAGLQRMFGNKTLASLNADLYSIDDLNPTYNVNTGSYDYNADQKETFAIISVTIDNLFLNKPVSVYDVRRSYYLGHYLHGGEAGNSLTIRYATQDINLSEALVQPLIFLGIAPFNPAPVGVTRFGADDKFSFGLLDMLEVNAEGALFQPSGRYGSIGLTLHNLNFSGPELSDFDYFFGMINRPGDYTLSVDFSSSNVDFTPSTGVSATVGYGIIEGLDVSVNYSHQRLVLSSAQTGNDWGFEVRGNLFGFMRAKASIDWGSTHYTLSPPYVERINQVQYNLNVGTFF